VRQSLRLVVFDFDGTLVDSQHMIAEVMLAAFEAHDLALPAPARIRRLVGLPLEQAIATLLPESMVNAAAKVTATYREFFREAMQRDETLPPLYDGMAALLAELDRAGSLLGICTGRARHSLAHMLKAHGLDRHFVTLQTGDRHPGKPHPAMLQAALHEAGVRPDDALMVGDTTFDMEMARNAGVAALGVAWGYHDAAELAAVGAEAAADAATLGATITAWLERS
jgi:phosphoglycolate phosphatase